MPALVISIEAYTTSNRQGCIKYESFVLVSEESASGVRKGEENGAVHITVVPFSTAAKPSGQLVIHFYLEERSSENCTNSGSGICSGPLVHVKSAVVETD